MISRGVQSHCFLLVLYMKVSLQSQCHERMQAPGLELDGIIPTMASSLMKWKWLHSPHLILSNNFFRPRKTLQTIPFFTYFKHHLTMAGLHLIIVTKLTFQNWVCKYEQWTPNRNIIALTSMKKHTDIIVDNSTCQGLKSALQATKYPSLRSPPSNNLALNISSLMCITSKCILLKIIWSFISHWCLFISGTPL